MGRLCGAVFGVLVAWLLVVGSAAPALSVPQGPSVYANDAMCSGAALTDNNSERGPSNVDAVCVVPTDQLDADHWSNVASECASGSNPYIGTKYNCSSQRGLLHE